MVMHGIPLGNGTMQDVRKPGLLTGDVDSQQSEKCRVTMRTSGSGQKAGLDHDDVKPHRSMSNQQEVALSSLVCVIFDSASTRLCSTVLSGSS